MSQTSTPLHSALQETDKLSASVATAPRVTLQDIQDNIKTQITFNMGDALELMGHPSSVSSRILTVCLIETKNGFTVIGKAAPADAKNFDKNVGATYAYEDAIRQLWPLMGYALRDQLARNYRPDRGD